jgi:hypothetical protein
VTIPILGVVESDMASIMAETRIFITHYLAL